MEIWKKKQPRYAKIPVLIFSTSGPRDMVGAARKKGADCFFPQAPCRLSCAVPRLLKLCRFSNVFQ